MPAALVALALAAGLAVPAAAVERWVPLGPSGGIVRLLTQAPSDPERLYAATDPAGIFRSRDGGRSWQSIRRGLEGPEIVRFAVDPGDSDFVLASAFGRSAQMWRSENGGSTWTPAARPPEGAAHDLLFDASAPRTIYAATESGIVRSLDRGSTWNSWALPNVFTLAISRDPAAPATWFASGFEPGGLLRGIFRSDDGGVTWRVTGSVGGPGFNELPERLFFHTGNLYAQWQGALYRSTDGATTWSLAARPPTFYAYDFALSPSGSIYAATDTGVYSSTDGVSWSPPEATPIDQASPSDRISRLALLPGDSGAGSETVIAAGRRGIWRSPDGGDTWRAASRGIGARIVGNLTVIPNPKGTVLATFEDGLFRIDRDGRSWRRLPRQTGFENHPHFAPDPHHPGRVYALGQGVGVSEDQGKTWATVGTFPYSTVQVFKVDPVHPGVLYAGVELGGGSSANGFAFKSVDGGVHWAEILSFEYLYGIEFDPAHPNVAFRLTSVGLDKSTDGGGTWTPLPDLRSQILGAEPTSLLFDPRSRALYLGTDQRGIFRSTDSGRTFRRIAGGLPRETGGLNPYVSTLVLDAAGDVYAAHWFAGVFRLRPGHGWTAVNTDFPLGTFVSALVADPVRPGLLYVGTFGSGVLRLEGR
ncbi:MAG TPA: hypothetical protein VGS22_29440 [Thermoanaerobaculia bacterium]|nr:hypothetical protein [Thermoanaerobaculia bacterium]